MTQQQFPAPPPGYYPQPPQKSKFWRNCLILGAIFAVIAIGGVVACTALVGSAVNSVSKQEAKVHHVTYSVGGTTRDPSITYVKDGSLTSADVNNAKLPWSKTIKVKGSFNLYSVTASTGFSGGSITCQIEVDGKVVKRAKATGKLATADCTG